MTEFTIGIAGKNILIRALYEYAKEYCQKYLSDGEPDFVVEITPADVEFERVKSEQEYEMEGLPPVDFQPEYLETLAIYRKIAEKMLDFNAFLFHGSALAVDGKGFLFTAKSGTGKSTHTFIWKGALADRCVMVNDDKPLLLVTEDGVWVCGTPWDGKHRRSTNIMVPLRGLAILERGKENEITPVESTEALPLLLQQTYRPSNPVALAKTLNLLEQAMAKVPLYRLKCTISLDAARVAYLGMNRKD